MEKPQSEWQHLPCNEAEWLSLEIEKSHLDGWFGGDDFWFLRFCGMKHTDAPANQMKWKWNTLKYYFRFCGTLNQWTVDVQIWHPVERGYCITLCRLLYIPEGYEIPQLHGELWTERWTDEGGWANSLSPIDSLGDHVWLKFRNFRSLREVKSVKWQKTFAKRVDFELFLATGCRSS